MKMKSAPDQARQAIKKINNDVANSTGLNKEEIDVAILYGQIDRDQAYFWTEEWQRDYREAQKDIEEGNYETFENVDSLLDYLHCSAFQKLINEFDAVERSNEPT
jgi:hypothetical protein